MGALSLIVFGGCLVQASLDSLARQGDRVRYAPYNIPRVYAFGEMFQVLDILRGERSLPLELYPLCYMHPKFGPVARAKDFADVDAVLLEPVSPVDVTFRSHALNRTALETTIKHPVARIDSTCATLADRWFRVGLMEFNPDIRAEAAAQLVERIPDNLPESELAKALILETRSTRVDVRRSLITIREMMGRPIGVATYVFQYLDDGRALSWPQGFREEIICAAKELDFPLFEPSDLVQQFGLRRALKEDLRHYREEFVPIMGDAFVAFAQSIRDGHNSEVA